MVLSSYDSWGNVTSRTYSGTTSTLTYDLLDHFVSWNAGTANKDLYVYDASGNRVLRRTTMTAYVFGLEDHSYFNAGGHKSNWNIICAQNFDSNGPWLI